MSKKIVITVKEQLALKSRVDPRFGRAPSFILINEEGEVLDELINQSVNAAHGAGTGTAALMGELEVTDIISGAFGPKAFTALDTMGINMWTVEDGLTVSDVLNKFKTGDLKKMEIKVY